MYALKHRPELSPKGVKTVMVDSTSVAIAGGQQ
jgi:hypothetical protein